MTDQEAPARWVAPWTPEQMRALAMRQYGGEFRPFTCPNRNDGEHLDESILMPSEHGWICAWCDFTQTWALDPGDLSGRAGREMDVAESEETEIDMLAAYSAALDEVYVLRRALAFEASVVEAHTLDLKALSKRRRHQLERAVERMRGAARGESAASYAEVNHRSLDQAMIRAGGSNVLTRASWEASLSGSSEEADRG